MADENTNINVQGSTGGDPEKTFTQAEVDALIQQRIARATKGMPTKEEFAEYKTWKESQQSEQDKLNAAISERDSIMAERDIALAEAEAAKRNMYVLKKGYNGDEAEFIAFKAAKMVSDTVTFEQAVDTLSKKPAQHSRFDWSAQIGGNSNEKPKTENELMNELIRGSRNGG